MLSFDLRSKCTSTSSTHMLQRILSRQQQLTYNLLFQGPIIWNDADAPYSLPMDVYCITHVHCQMILQVLCYHLWLTQYKWFMPSATTGCPRSYVTTSWSYSTFLVYKIMLGVINNYPKRCSPRWPKSQMTEVPEDRSPRWPKSQTTEVPDDRSPRWPNLKQIGEVYNVTVFLIRQDLPLK